MNAMDRTVNGLRESRQLFATQTTRKKHNRNTKS